MFADAGLPTTLPTGTGDNRTDGAMSNPIIEAWEAASNSQRREFVVVAASRIELLRQQMESERWPIPDDYDHESRH